MGPRVGGKFGSVASFDSRVAEIALDQGYLVTRADVLGLGGSDDMIDVRLGAGRWERVHAGVYQIDRRQRDWRTVLLAATLACGPESRVSHRAALKLWEMDGIRSAPVEITMPFGNLAVPEGVLVHRSRRPTPFARAHGVPVSGPERTILEGSASLPDIIIGKALDSAIRNDLTSVERVSMVLSAEGGRGVRGRGG